MPTDINDEFVDSAVVDVDDRFHVCDERSANWVLRKVIELRAYRQHVAEWAEAETIRADRQEAFLLHRFGAELERWTRDQLAQQRGRKSIRLPAGKLGFRTSPTTLQINDEPRLLAWCQRHLPSALKAVQHVLKSVVMEHVKDTGELPDGSEITSGGERFYIK
jgi:phage host-nuclease inhibitor protein Gam